MKALVVDCSLALPLLRLAFTEPPVGTPAGLMLRLAPALLLLLLVVAVLVDLPASRSMSPVAAMDVAALPMILLPWTNKLPLCALVVLSTVLPSKSLPVALTDTLVPVMLEPWLVELLVWLAWVVLLVEAERVTEGTKPAPLAMLLTAFTALLAATRAPMACMRVLLVVPSVTLPTLATALWVLAMAPRAPNDTPTVMPLVLLA